MKHKQLVIVASAILCVSIVFVALASSILWNTTVAITIQSSNGWIKVYSDSSCTQEVTGITFPSIPRGTTSPTISLYVKNTHPSATFTIYCNSTAGIVSSNTIIDTWSGISNWGTTIYPGQVIGTSYYLSVTGGCILGTYNWTLTIYSIS